ncbi:hypothetical protein LaP1706_gp60 [Lactococcus phage 1706]|uniref:Uncharacterized protein n=1 Tax=Lactococcus phage 1706 TaxID=475178 RepID=B2BTM4_9CAUD|nr:hypothetical protein LaP1706_gp60 [Lactococcus phage 1706]ABV91267.1 unknown [Lactococcus phage 1706]
MAFIKKEQKQNTEEAWLKFKKESDMLDHEVLVAFEKEVERPILLYVNINENISYLIKANATLGKHDNDEYCNIVNNYYQDKEGDVYPPKVAVPKISSPYWDIPIKKTLKQHWLNKRNIVLDIADGITTVMIKYEDIERMQIVEIHNYKEVEEIRGLIGETDNIILGIYPELEEDMEKWAKE